MVTWNFRVLEIWVAHEFGSIKLKLVPTVCPPQQLVHKNQDDVKERLLLLRFIYCKYACIAYKAIYVQTVPHVCVCVRVFFPFILDVKFVGCTSRGHTGGRSHMISHPPSFCGACLYFFLEKDSAVPFPRRPCCCCCCC